MSPGCVHLISHSSSSNNTISLISIGAEASTKILYLAFDVRMKSNEKQRVLITDYIEFSPCLVIYVDVGGWVDIMYILCMNVCVYKYTYLHMIPLPPE